MKDAKQFWTIGDAVFGYQTEDGIEAYPLAGLDINSLIPASDNSVVYDASEVLSTSHTYTFRMTPQEMWNLRCLLWGWKTDFTYRKGWNRRITGDTP